MRKVVSGESGRALLWALVVLGIGALLIPPLLASISTNLFATRAVEESLKEQYAADAGVEQAIFLMSTGDYNLGESFDPPPLVNNLPVSVTITVAAEDVYKIMSEAGDIRIESYVSTNYTNLAWLLGNGITSYGNVTLQSNTVISGDVRYGGDLGGQGVVAGGYTAEEDEDIVEDWPETSDLSDFYWLDVQGLDPYPAGSIDVGSGTEAEPYPLGPLYRDGDLDIESSQNLWDAAAVLSGTIYVTGQLNIGGAKLFTLDLNGQAIYVEYIGTGYAIVIGGAVTISGSGVIIAEGGIFFQPNSETSPDDFVFVMSVSGEARVNPSGDFYGAVVGKEVVIIQPGNFLEWTNPYNKGLNFPNGTKGVLEFVTYRIYPR